MEVITKCVVIENEKFVLIRDKKEGLPECYKNGEYYGTIPYAELDEHGKLKRQLNGFEIGIEASAGEALRYRMLRIRLKKFDEEKSGGKRRNADKKDYRIKERHKVSNQSECRPQAA